MLGAKVGENTEISTASNVTHHLLEIGDGSFIADDVVLGESEVKNQEITLINTIIGNKSFVGNSALFRKVTSLAIICSLVYCQYLLQLSKIETTKH